MIEQGEHVARQHVDRVRLDRRRRVGVAKAPQIRHQHAVAGRRQGFDLVAPRVPELGKSVQQQYQRSAGGAVFAHRELHILGRHLDACRAHSGNAIPASPAAELPSLNVSATRSDIATRADCEQLVRAFYARALTDPVIGWLFTDVAHLDLDAHLPRIASFWETILLGTRSYSGGAFAPHAALHARAPLRAGHFERWLWLWGQTVDELFAGERAALAKEHAARVAAAFAARLAQPDAPGAPTDSELLLPVIHRY